MIDGSVILAEALEALNIDLTRLVARCSIWVNPDVFSRVAALNQNAVWYPDTRRARAGKVDEIKGTKSQDGIIFDDNSKANTAIKQAIFPKANKGCTGMAVCHIWPNTCYDERYHTALGNLVLLPAPLASLADHHTEIKLVLRFRSYELFGWHPAEFARPEQPKQYPPAEVWASPITVDRAVEQRIKRLERRL